MTEGERIGCIHPNTARIRPAMNDSIGHLLAAPGEVIPRTTFVLYKAGNSTHGIRVS